MKGLELSRRYYTQTVMPAFRSEFPADYGLMAFGLAGPGSECYGYDDEISRDHDWGPKICIWIPDDLYRSKGEELQQFYESLPKECCGYGPITRRDPGVRREGVLSIDGFYASFLGIEGAPRNYREWLIVDEQSLSMCTNGEVFYDPSGIFSGIRAALLSYYPMEIRLKKIAGRCLLMSQHGQYNLWRSVKRGDLPAAEYDKAIFAREAAHLVFLLEGKYRPFYKWLFRALEDIGGSGEKILSLLYTILQTDDHDELYAAVEEVAAALIRKINGFLKDREEEMAGGGISRGIVESNFLQNIGFEVEKRIQDDFLREQIGIVQ